jgi:hypothetical protein
MRMVPLIYRNKENVSYEECIRLLFDEKKSAKVTHS